MKIVVDGRMINQSGIGVYTRELLALLDKKSYSVAVLLNKQDASDYSFKNVQVTPIEFGRYSWKNLLFLRRYIRNSDIYFCPFLSVPPLFSTVPSVATVHDLCPVSEPKFFGVRIAIAYWILMLFQLTISRQAVAISDFTRSEISKWFCGMFDKKVSVVSNGLSIKRHNKNSQSEFSVDSPYILTVGNIKPHKNTVNLAKAFLQSKWRETHRLVIVGDQEGFRTKVKDVDFNDSRVIFTGKISDTDLHHLYQNASLFVYPSFYEGFGLPLLEAMSYRLPIACSSIPPFYEIADDSVTYFNPHHLDTFWQLLEIKGGPKNYDTIINKYTWKAALANLLDIFEQSSSTCSASFDTEGNRI